MSEVADKLRKAARGGFTGSSEFALINAKRLFDCSGQDDFALFNEIASAIEAERREQENIKGVSDTFNVPRDCELISVHPFVLDCSDKEQACKVLEEAAEVFGAWQTVEQCAHIDAPNVCDCKRYADDCAVKAYLADEIADVVQAACNLAARYDLDVAAAMVRCEERNRERGRYD